MVLLPGSKSIALQHNANEKSTGQFRSVCHMYIATKWTVHLRKKRQKSKYYTHRDAPLTEVKINVLIVLNML